MTVTMTPRSEEKNRTLIRVLPIPIYWWAAIAIHQTHSSDVGLWIVFVESKKKTLAALAINFLGSENVPSLELLW